ncbi:hypothetical protein Aab01nite_19250 [Paractinoplanes abujensis]|uniref:Uncharacterized protein n=1 Tax=Paractinoplanes abujensis TaxID=882441 RepID=A0A7W7G5P0_9ACTN|nr:hypothetical protein [Actinoplanes abujensis]MBB4697192.1 hypothetical protein [Actinoplanes abujensis]GID18335.1 hypothetical protein Aab01nite_19250 [Actinoplanes abujensis]
MEIPGLGPVVEDVDAGWFESEPIFVPVLGKECRFHVEGYDAGPDFHAAIRTFLPLDRDALLTAAPIVPLTRQRSAPTPRFVRPSARQGCKCPACGRSSDNLIH